MAIMVDDEADIAAFANWSEDDAADAAPVQQEAVQAAPA